MPQNEPTLTLEEANALVVFFGKKYTGKTLGQIIASGNRGLLYVNWLAELNAINGPQPREDRIRLHRAAQLLAHHHEMAISHAIEEVDAKRRARMSGDSVPVEDV